MSEKSTDLVVRASGMVEQYAHLLPEREREPSALARLKESVAGVMRSNPALLQAAKGDAEALYGAVVAALRLGLTFDPAFGHAWLVPRKGKICFQVGYKGLKELALRAGDVKGARVELVWPGDGFEYTAEPPMLRHTPDIWGTKGPRTYATCLGGYAVVEIDGGRLDFLVMRKEEIEARRDVSASKGGPWATWPVEMARKTVLAALLRRQRLSVADRDVATVLHADMMADVAVAEERQLPAPRGRTQPAADDVVDAEVEEPGAGVHPRIGYLLGDDLSLETLCWYLAARDSKPIDSPTLEAANAWAAGVADGAWAKSSPLMREAITRRLGLIKAAGGPLALLGVARAGSPMWAKANAAADRLGLAKAVAEWPPRAQAGIAIAVAEEKTEPKIEKVPPGEAALRKALDVPGGEDAVKLALAQVGAPWPTEDSDKGELAYIIEKHCHASACHADTVALLCEALSNTGEI